MKPQTSVTLLLAGGLLAGCTSDNTHYMESQAQMQAEAKISEADARATALAKVPNGTIKEAELEREKGRLIWSFDIATPNTKDITEVAVDAVKGSVVSTEKETVADQAKEKAEDAKKEKKDND